MDSARRSGSHRRIVASVAVGVLILSGAAVLLAALSGSAQSSANPSHPTSASLAGRVPSSTPTTRSPGGGATGLPASDPVRLRIPAMQVDAGLVRLGADAATRTMTLPHPVTKAGWYEKSATPGSVGTSIIVGYIAGRQAVFGRLAALHRADTVRLLRKDGQTATYQVDSIRGYAPGKLPTAQIYAATTTPTLRLISCGGRLHPGQPAENVVVSAHLQQTS